MKTIFKIIIALNILLVFAGFYLIYEGKIGSGIIMSAVNGAVALLNINTLKRL